MSEKLELLELDLEIGQVTAKASKTQQEIEKLRIEISALKKEQKSGFKIIEHYKNNLSKLEAQGRGSGKGAIFLRERILKQQKALDSTSESITKATANQKNLQKDYNTSSRILQAYTEKKQKELKGYKQAGGSIKQLGSALAENRKLYENLTEAERSNKDIGGKLLKTIQAQDKEYKKLKEGIGQAQGSVGNYREEMKNAIKTSFSLQQASTAILGPLGTFAPLLATNIQSLLAYRNAQITSAKATKGTSKALKLFKIALISTGIGAIVVLIGTLVSAFLSTQKGIDTVNKALAPLKGAFKRIWGVLQKVSGSLNVFDRFKDSFTILKNQFLLGANLMRLAWAKIFGNKDKVAEIQKEIAENTTEMTKAISRVKKGAKEFTDSFKDAGKHIKDSVDAQVKIEELTIKIANAENDLIVKKADLLDKIKEQEQIAKNTALSSAERNKAVEEAKRLSDELANSETDILDLKIKQKELQNSQNDTDREAQKELNELIAQRKAKETEGRARELKFLGTKNQLAKEAEKKRAESQKKAIDHQQKLLELYILVNNKEKSSLAEKLKLAKDVHKKEMALIEQKKKAGLLSETEIAIEQEKSRQKLLNTQTSLALENAQKELEIYTAKKQHILDNETKLNADLLAQQKAYLDERARLQIEALQKESLSAEEFSIKKAEIEREQLQAKQEQEKAFEEQKKQEKQQKFEEHKTQLQIDNEVEIQSLIDKNASKFEIEQERAEQEMEMKLLENENSSLTTEQKEQRELLIKQQYAEQQKQIEKAKNQNKLDLASQTLGNLVTLLGQESEAGKAVAVAQATIDTYKAATSAYSAMAGIPVVGPALGAIAAAAAVAVGIANVKKITSTKKPSIPKASKGITLQGNSHANGGIGLFDAEGNQVVEAEGGENIYAITNKKASSMINEKGLLGTLSYINQNIGGGVPLTKNVNYASAGGLVQTRLNSSTNVREVVTAFDDRVDRIQVINVAEDTVNIARESIIVENEANI